MTDSTLTGFHRHCLSKGLSFVSWRMPGDNLPLTIPVKPVKIISGLLPLSTKGFIFAPFDISRDALWFKAEMLISGYKVEPGHFIDAGPDVKPEIAPALPHSTDKQSYIEGFNLMMDAIKAGKITKGVLSRAIRIPFQSTEHAPLLFNDLCQAFPEAFVYLLYAPVTGIWLGASPELLISSAGSRIRTMALAGTRPAGTQGEWGAKELDEQEWVSRYIKAKLEISGCSGIEQTPVYTAKAGNVEHLRTDFQAMATSDKVNNVLNNLHPTPAVCGWPVDEARDVIKDAEGYNRSFYTGYLGPVNIGNMTSLYVNLRCMQAIDNEAALYAGGGITKGSDAGKEWDETSIKSRTLLVEIEKIRNLAH